MLKKKVLCVYISISLLLFLISFCNKIIYESSYKFINTKSNFDVAVVLGTAKFLKNKKENLFYRKRIQKAVELYMNGMIKYIVVSGDNSSKGYDEPTLMKNDLIKNGVPRSKIYCDYAGFSTVDSMLRMKLIFRESRFVVVSQRFHIERAVYIARRNGLDVYGKSADDVPLWYAPYNNYREKLARVKAVFEVITGRGPFFGGEPVLIKKT